MSEQPILDEWSEEPEEQEPQEAEEHEAKGGRAQERIRQLIAERDAERIRAAQAEEKAQKMADLEGKVRALMEERKVLAEKPVEQPPIPEFVEDPVGHVDAKVGRLQAELARLEKLAADGNAKAEAEAAATREQLALQQFMDRVRTSEQTFLSQHPDYYAALEYARQVKTREMEYLGMEKPEIATAINTEEVNAAMAAIARGKDPAEFVYRRALASGFKAGTSSQKLDEQVDLYERRRMASSIGSGAGEEGTALEPAGDAWAAIDSAFQELYGEKLR